MGAGKKKKNDAASKLVKGSGRVHGARWAKSTWKQKASSLPFS